MRCRSKSDGGESLQPPSEPFEVFPSLPLDILEKMDLIGMEPKYALKINIVSSYICAATSKKAMHMFIVAQGLAAIL